MKPNHEENTEAKPGTEATQDRRATSCSVVYCLQTKDAGQWRTIRQHSNLAYLKLVREKHFSRHKKTRIQTMYVNPVRVKGWI